MASNPEPTLEPAGAGRAAARRQRVVDVARCLFSNHGFHGTGIARIATDSGVAVAQIYRDFQCKEDIVASIVAQDCNLMLEREALSAALAAGDAQAIRGWIARVFDPAVRGDRDENIFLEIIAESSRNPRMAAIFRATHDQVCETLCSALTLFAPGDEMTDRRTILAETILTLAFALHHRPLIDNDHINERLIASFKQLIQDQIAALEADSKGQVPTTSAQ